METTLKLSDEDDSYTFVSLGMKLTDEDAENYIDSTLFPIGDPFKPNKYTLKDGQYPLNKIGKIYEFHNENFGTKRVRLISITSDCEEGKEYSFGGCEITVVEDKVTGDINQNAGKRSTRKRSIRKRSICKRSIRRRSIRRRY